MKITILAVGQRIVPWAQRATRRYLSRFPRDFSVELKEIRTEPRNGQTPAKLKQAEGDRILQSIASDDFVVILDEHGKDCTTMDLAHLCAQWRREKDHVVFVIGGPDGLSPEVKERGNFCLRLSQMTLPHAMARVLLAEQLYRAWSILVNHPYHRA